MRADNKLNNPNPQGSKLLRVTTVCLMAGLGIYPTFSANTVFAEENGLFGFGESVLGSTNEHLTADRYRRLLPIDYNLKGETAEHWQILNDLLRYQSLENKLKLTQQFFNTIHYMTDMEAFGRQDYWASIGEFMAVGGDCEDFAIAKYRALVDTGFPAEKLRVVLVEDMVTGLDHAVLSAELDGRTYILDNQYPQVMDARYVNTYRPLYSMNQYTIWKHTQTVPDAFVSVETKMPPTPGGGQ